MVDEPAANEHADARLDVLRLTDEVIGLSAELAELRTQVERALERSTAAAEIAQAADVVAQAAAADTRAFGEYLGQVTDGLGARSAAAETADVDLTALSRDELIARVEELEAVLGRRSVRAALGMTKKLRGS